MTFRHEVKLTENVTVVVIDGQDVSNPYTVTVTDVPPKAGSLGVRVRLPVDAFIQSHDGIVDGAVIEQEREPQKVRPSIGLPFVKLTESVIYAGSTIEFELQYGIVIV